MISDKVTNVDINSDMVDSERNGPMRKSKNRDTILKIKEKLSEDDNRSGNSTDMEESIPTKQPRKRKKVGNTVEQVRDEATRMKKTYRATMQRKMRMQRQKCVEERPAQIGDCVKLSLDKRDIPHSRGLLGVVCNVARGGGIQVVTLELFHVVGKYTMCQWTSTVLLRWRQLRRWCQQNFKKYVRQSFVVSSNRIYQNKLRWQRLTKRSITVRPL
jgi:hypothetical protein